MPLQVWYTQTQSLSQTQRGSRFSALVCKIGLILLQVYFLIADDSIERKSDSENSPSPREALVGLTLINRAPSPQIEI